jgi:hypothetical protein
MVSSRRRLIVDFVELHDSIAIPELTLIEQKGRRFTFEFDPGQAPVDTLIASLATAYPIRDLYVESIPIERIIADYYGGTV